MRRRHEPVTLADRVEALDQSVALAAGRLDQADLAAVSAVLLKVRGRMGHGTEQTVVALAGSTGVGKSSLFNAIAGETLSDVGVRRPTTGAAHAAIWRGADTAGSIGVSDLLDWLGVNRRHHVAVEVGHPLSGLLLIDLPDFDSTETSNRAEVDRMLQLVDLVVWVTDPQKYADEVFHDGYIRPIAAYSDVLRFVLNRTDTVAEHDVGTITRDLAARLVDDGIPKPSVTVTSVTARHGLTDVEGLLQEAIAARRSMTARLEEDVHTAAMMLLERVGDETRDAGVTGADRRRFIDRLAVAAGADAAGNVVAEQHRHDARRMVGWAPLRLFGRWRRPQPIADLPRASVGTAAGSEVHAALREVAEAGAGEAPPPWPSVLRRQAERHDESLRRDLTTLTRTTAYEAVRPPSWWRIGAIAQRFFAAVAAVGAVWLIVASAAGGFLNLDTDPLLIDTPGADWIPLPSLLVLGGLAVGGLLALVAAVPVRIGASRRGARVRDELTDGVARLVDATVLPDLDRVLDERRQLRTLLEEAAQSN